MNQNTDPERASDAMRSTGKVMPLVSILLLGVLRLGPDLADAQEESKPAKSVHLAPPQGGGAPSPRYVYGPGYYGYGYYEYTSPAPRPRPAGPHNYATTPGMFGPGGMKVGPYHRDWTTGRSSPLAKPWLRPMD